MTRNALAAASPELNIRVKTPQRISSEEILHYAAAIVRVK